MLSVSVDLAAHLLPEILKDFYTTGEDNASIA